MRHVSRILIKSVPAFVLAMLPLQAASAVELIKDLDCALTKETHIGADYCLKVLNTCNTPIVSRIQERGGTQKDTIQVPKGERSQICSSAPFTFLGSYIAGPLAQGAGDQ